MLRVVALAVALLLAQSSASSGQCETTFDSTFAMVQELIFARRGCTPAPCHAGPDPGGGLDLSPDVAWQNLFEVPARTVSRPGLVLVAPGRKQDSLLWLNLAGAVFPDLWQAPLRPMPIGSAPLSLDEIELLRVWIEHGALPSGIVPESVDLIGDGCTGPVRPLEAVPLEPPEPELGIQIRAPRLHLPPQSETEVCFISHQSFRGAVPEWALTEDGEFFAATLTGDRRDPLTHHQVVFSYAGDTPIDDPIWGQFTCKHGPHQGEPCDPRAPDACGATGACGSLPQEAIACIGYGPADASPIGGKLLPVLGVDSNDAGDIVSLLPVESVFMWNSHAFNVTEFEGKVDRWLNFEFVDASELDNLRVSLPIFTLTELPSVIAPAYAAREHCAFYVVPDGMDVRSLSFHTHRRGVRWRTFSGEFRCRSGAHRDAACSPTAAAGAADICDGAECTAYAAPAAGDCNGDNLVSIDELILGVRIVLGEAESDRCPSFSRSGSALSIEDLVMAVGGALLPVELDADEALLYLGFDYADPFERTFSPPLRIAEVPSSRASRTLTYCAVYDNGVVDPTTVVRNSRRPGNADPCVPTHCAQGRVGAACPGDDEASHLSCDSFPGAGDGMCDACSLSPGVTTDDEMFLLVGRLVSRPEEE